MSQTTSTAVSDAEVENVPKLSWRAHVTAFYHDYISGLNPWWVFRTMVTVACYLVLLAISGYCAVYCADLVSGKRPPSPFDLIPIMVTTCTVIFALVLMFVFLSTVWEKAESGPYGKR